MAAKGSVAKQKVIDKIIESFGENFLGILDKKIYIKSEEDGEEVQVAIALTCPKTGISKTNQVSSVESENEISNNEREIIQNLMKQLDL